MLLLGVAIATTAVVHARMDTGTALDRGEMFVPRPDRARLSTLGFDAVVADYYWLRALQVVGRVANPASSSSGLLVRLMEVLTEVDPWVDHPYRFAAVWLTQTPELVRRANRLLERGIAYHPDDWRNRYHLAFNHFFYLNEYRRAADVLEAAIDLEDAPRYLGALVARLRAEGGSLETAAALLQTLARGTDDEYARAEYLKALDEVQVERWARRLDAARVEYWRRNGHDIASVGDLVEGPRAVLRSLPPAHPHFPGFGWTLHEGTGQIVSSFYGSRYELHRSRSPQAES